jgi:hypothetical protein
MREKEADFALNARKKGGRTLIKIPWPIKKENYHPPAPSPLSRELTLSHACLCIISSPSTPPHDYFETTMFGTRAKRHEISYGNLTTAKKHEIS